MKYSLSPAFATPQISVAPTVPQKRVPLLGPEIGPDPRNANCTIRLPRTPTQEENGVFFDFNFGYRVQCPAGVRCRVRVYDRESDLLLAEHVTEDGAMIVGERKYYIPYRLEVTRLSDDKVLVDHHFDCAGRPVTIVVPDGGLGDNLAWMPLAEQFRQKYGADVTCVIGEWLIRMIRDQYPELKFVPIGTQPPLGGAYACYYCAIFPKDRKNWRPSDHQNWGMQRSVQLALGVPLEDIKVRLKLDSPRPCPEPFVCISAMATNPAKHWNYPDGWNTVIRWLRSLGYRVFCIDRDKELAFGGVFPTAIPAEAEDCTGAKPLVERIAMMQHADFFIGLPSGLSWLAWNCNIPVVMISGFSLEGCEFPTPYRVTNFKYCHGCWNDSQEFFDMTAMVWCPRHRGTPREIECTKMISPKMVMNTIRRLPVFRERHPEEAAKQE